MTEALVLQRLHFGYGRRADVRDVTLGLSPGDCYGFLGHNGAGKTTVMRLALGLLRPRRGDVHIFGIDALRQPRLARALVGALIERPGFQLHLTARQNLVALARLQGIARQLATAEADRVLDDVGLASAAHRRVGTFSMGMKQRLGIGQALLGQPRLVLLDEPTNGLDPEGIAELRALLTRLTRDDGVAVLLSSHQLAELEGLCTRIGVLRDGAMVVEGALDQLRQRVGLRHVVRGSPLSRIEERLEQRGLTPIAEGDRLIVDLQQQDPAAVVRDLSANTELLAFAPEQATLEKIYLQAARLETGGADVAAPPTRADAPAAARATAVRLGDVAHPFWRAYTYELTNSLRQRSTVPLLLLPSAIGAFAALRYASSVQQGLARVEDGSRFSADAGSGFLGLAQGLQNATPALALVLLWLTSQTIAADLSADTLRNTLLRSLRRSDVAMAKAAAHLTTMVGSWSLLLATTAGVAWLQLGFGDLEEVTRYGDRDLLAAIEDVRPVALLTVLQMLLPLMAWVAVGMAASALAKRPARAFALAAVVALGPELLRDACGERAGWLLTSHLPLFFRDDSALRFLADTARGAADAVWPWSEFAVGVPLLWTVLAGLILGIAFRRLRVS